MSDYTLFDIVQGETLLQEFRLLDDDRLPVDLTSAAKIVKTSSPLLPTDFEFVGTLDLGGFTLRADGVETGGWPPGIHDIQLWLDWGEFAFLKDERIMDIKVSVKAALA